MSPAHNLSVSGGLPRVRRKPIKIVDTSVRDGNQSLWAATGITTGMVEAMGPIYEEMGLFALDFTSSTHLSMGVKFHGEPVNLGPIVAATFEDTCGNLIHLVQVTG